MSFYDTPPWLRWLLRGLVCSLRRRHEFNPVTEFCAWCDIARWRTA